MQLSLIALLLSGFVFLFETIKLILWLLDKCQKRKYKRSYGESGGTSIYKTVIPHLDFKIDFDSDSANRDIPAES